MTVALLETLGFSTIEAGDGAQALGLLESDASVDLLLTDIVLPGGMLGLELARRVTDLAPGTKVLFMSGYSEYLTLESGDQSHKLGADVPLLPKPFDRTKLARMVRAALDD
jgi:CheY-like chemotaxis protein